MRLIDRAFQPTRTFRRAGAAAFHMQMPASAGICMGTGRGHANAWFSVRPLVIAFAGLATGLALAATPPNTPITNTASATYGISGTPVTVLDVIRSPDARGVACQYTVGGLALGVGLRATFR